jgi:hypothetical protein
MLELTLPKLPLIKTAADSNVNIAHHVLREQPDEEF